MRKAVRELQAEMMDFRGIVFAYGNTKIPRSTLIVNLTSALHCPAKKRGLCKVDRKCYAKKDERIYKNYENKNLQVEKWINSASTIDIIKLMTVYIENAPERITKIRLSEAGDFICQNQIRQWDKIAEHFKREKNIVTYTYTARADLDFSVAPNIIVNGSLPHILGAARMYKCIPANVFDNMWDLKTGQYKCPGSCKVCSLCASYQLMGGTIFAREH